MEKEAVELITWIMLNTDERNIDWLLNQDLDKLLELKNKQTNK